MLERCKLSCPRIENCLLCVVIDTPKQLRECPCVECIVLPVCMNNCELRESVYKKHEHQIDKWKHYIYYKYDKGVKSHFSKITGVKNVQNREGSLIRNTNGNRNTTKLPRSKKTR